MRRPKLPPWLRDREIWFRMVELLVIISATAIAWRALERNTEGIVASGSTNLFAADTQVEREELNGANGPVWTIYGKPNTTDPAAYTQQLLAAIAKHSKSIVEIPNAHLLYQKLIELNPPDDERQDIAELRRVKSHLTLILNELHSGYDFWSKGIIRKSELLTWLGYLQNIGPNPLFLAEIAHWRDSRFMSREFAEMLQTEMLKDPFTRKVIHSFYPEMEKPSFLDGLPDYGKPWNTSED